MIPREQWKYKGIPGHFCCARKCVFRLHTIIGKYKISTVGAMYDIDKYGHPVGDMQEIGCGTHYETMVFHNNSWSEIYCHSLAHDSNDDPTDTDAKAEKMHDNVCLMVAKGEIK